MATNNPETALVSVIVILRTKNIQQGRHNCHHDIYWIFLQGLPEVSLSIAVAPTDHNEFNAPSIDIISKHFISTSWLSGVNEDFWLNNFEIE